MRRTTSFSRVPARPIAPGSSPPCPGSIAIVTSRVAGPLVGTDGATAPGGRDFAGPCREVTGGTVAGASAQAPGEPPGPPGRGATGPPELPVFGPGASLS